MSDSSSTSRGGIAWLTNSGFLAGKEVDIVRVVVLSDLHAFSPVAGGPTPSHLSTATPENNRQHPLVGFASLLRDNDITANAVLCCGDLGDRAEVAAIAYAWKYLPIIQGAVGAPLLAATTGNHDVDSRLHTTGFDPRAALRDLVPPFPVPDGDLSRRYWADDYVICEQPDLRVLVLNSSAYHGVAGEQDHGRVAARTIDNIRTELDDVIPKRVNLLMCHHHPHKYGDVETADYSDMIGSYLLTNLLGSGRSAAWMIAHRHRLGHGRPMLLAGHARLSASAPAARVL